MSDTHAVANSVGLIGLKSVMSALLSESAANQAPVGAQRNYNTCR